MSISSLQFLPASRGTLVKLRRQLNLVVRGKEILEMRREQLVKELFEIMDKLKERGGIEHEYLRVLEEVCRLRTLRGEYEYRSITSLIEPPEAEVLLISIQGVTVPQVRITRDPDLSKIKDPEYRMAFERLWKVLKRLFELANLEVAVEKLSRQLNYINRIVNSLEKNVIPNLKETIRYVEEKVNEEMLEEFVRLREVAKEV
ncbi:MAG: V-type ATP synthase subunit D [Thermoprotei archaeon]|nr:V-type ATP synthase subunit D [Thermoprotei archaeon]